MGRSLLLLLLFLGSLLAVPPASSARLSSPDCLACGEACCCAAVSERCACLAPAEPGPAPAMSFVASGLYLPVCLDSRPSARLVPPPRRLAFTPFPRRAGAHPLRIGLLLEQLSLPPPA